jgi:hypothetical protein
MPFDEWIVTSASERFTSIASLRPDPPKPRPPFPSIRSVPWPLPMALLVERAVKARLKGQSLPKFKYRDFGNLVDLSD